MKKSFLIILTLLGVSSVVQAGDLMINFKADQGVVADIILKIEGDLATATVGAEIERFNLKQMSWLNEKTGQWVTLAQCKEWAEQSKAKSLRSVESAPAKLRPFLMWSLDPYFTVTKTNGTLRLVSGQVDYFIEGQASKTDVDEYFRYAVLNAYKKAMTERKLPPYSELKVIDEMKTLGYIPRTISVRIPGLPGAPAVDIRITKRDGKGQPSDSPHDDPTTSVENSSASGGGCHR